MSRVLAMVLALIGVMAFSGTALAAHTAETTINLRTCVDTGDDTCQSVDGVVVCLQGPRTPTVCGATEDGEFWVDSRPHGPYRAWVEPHPDYQLLGITCTTFPGIPYAPCQVRGNQVRFVVSKDVDAVNINFSLAATP